jgi:phospholipase C
VPDYTQLGFRVPAIVVSNLAPAQVIHHGPYEHASTLKLIESTFGLQSLTARDANARDLGEVLERFPRRAVRAGAVPRSSEVPGPANDAAAVCSAASVQSVSPRPVRLGRGDGDPNKHHRSGYPTGHGMAGFGRKLRGDSSDE